MVAILVDEVLIYDNSDPDLENNRWTDFLDGKACRGAAARPKIMKRTLKLLEIGKFPFHLQPKKLSTKNDPNFDEPCRNGVAPHTKRPIL